MVIKKRRCLCFIIHHLRFSQTNFSLFEVVPKENQNSIKFYVDNESIVGGITLNNNDSENLELQCKTVTNIDINLEFFLKYLIRFTKMCSTGQQVNLYLSKIYPLIVQFKFDELGDGNWTNL